MVFVHGGYWRAFGRKDWSHLAKGAVKEGYAVAVPSYTLCPAIRISGIARQIKTAVEHAASEVDGPIFLTGHSAGGHLVTRLCCEDTVLQRDVIDRIKRIVPISGLFDLRPLIKASMNEQLRLDRDEAERESPALCSKTAGIPITAWVGGLERPAFIVQSRAIASAWPETELRIEAGRHHFDVIEDLETPGSPLMRALLDGV